MSELPTNRSDRRLLGLDQARAVAIVAMLAAHFAPGVFAQFPGLEPVRDTVNAFARLATPTFVVVFGVTIGFVYLPRYWRRGPHQTAASLRRRSAVMLVCAGVIAVPAWVWLAVEGDKDAWAWLSALYSVLLFYALALALLPAWLRWISPVDAEASGGADSSHGTLALKCLLAGAALWAVGTAAHRLVPERSPGGAEYVRTLLVSGSFAYFQLMGTALLAVPIGVWLRDRWEDGGHRRSLISLLLAALGLFVLGGLWGWAAGEYDWGRLLSGELRTPPRAWYFMHIGGLGLALIPMLELLTRALPPVRTPAYLLALFGQVGLLVYTGHVFVLPGLALTDRFLPLHGIGRVVAALVPFTVFCGLVMYARHRRRRAITSSPASTRSSSAHSLPLR